MKLIDRITPVLESLSLAFLGGVLLWLAMSGRYASFMSPSARLGVIASDVGLFICTLVLSARIDTGEYKNADTTISYRAMTYGLVIPLAIVLLILPFHVSPSGLAVGTVSARPTSGGSTIDADTNDSTKDTPRTSNDTASGGTSPASDSDSQNVSTRQASLSRKLELTTDNFCSQVKGTTTSGRAYDDQRVKLTGFVLDAEAASIQTSTPHVMGEKSFVVARMAIWYCTVDACPVGFAVR